MSTYTQILYQLVFSTKYRNPTLLKENRKDLYKCIWGILNNKSCVIYQIGGIEDHTHIIFDLHPSIALSNLVKDIKLGATSFIKEKEIFPDFGGWQDGYGAFTYAMEAKDRLVNYVKNQEEHHKTQNSADELRQMLDELKVPFDEKYFL